MIYNVADYVNTNNCKAIVLTEPESYYDKKLVKALIKGLKSEDILWTSVIKFSMLLSNFNFMYIY